MIAEGPRRRLQIGSDRLRAAGDPSSFWLGIISLLITITRNVKANGRSLNGIGWRQGESYRTICKVPYPMGGSFYDLPLSRHPAHSEAE